jgi:hypothetical protein
MSDYQPPAATVLDWLRANLGSRALGALTGTDTRALRAAVQIIEHYAYDRDARVLVAFRLIVLRMQPKTRELAYHAIAHPLDWIDRIKVWAGAGLEYFEPRLKCSFEPGGSRIDHLEREQLEEEAP